jgi:hypothetical protein
MQLACLCEDRKPPQSGALLKGLNGYFLGDGDLGCHRVVIKGLNDVNALSYSQPLNGWNDWNYWNNPKGKDM